MTKHILLPFCSQRVQEKDSLNKINKPIWSCNLQSSFVCFFDTAPVVRRTVILLVARRCQMNQPAAEK